MYGLLELVRFLTQTGRLKVSYVVNQLCDHISEVVDGALDRFFERRELSLHSFPAGGENTFLVFDNSRRRVGAVASIYGWTIELYVDLLDEPESGYVPDTDDEMLALLSHITDRGREDSMFHQLRCFAEDQRLNAAFQMAGFSIVDGWWVYDLTGERARDVRNKAKFAA